MAGRPGVVGGRPGRRLGDDDVVGPGRGEGEGKYGDGFGDSGDGLWVFDCDGIESRDEFEDEDGCGRWWWRSSDGGNGLSDCSDDDLR